MNSIEAYRQEIEMQPASISAAASRLDGAPDRLLTESQQLRSIFAGSGDSLAASMLAEYFSRGRARAMDPSDVLRNPHLAAGLHRLYLVSVSGNTIANIRAAREFSEVSVAITASPDSRLAAASKAGVMPVEFSHAGDAATAGSASFVLSAIACVSLVCDIRGAIRDVSETFERARLDASEILVEGSLYMLGDLLTYPLAMYGAAKFYEVLGYDARYVRTEQFSHMELFSACRGDTVLLLGGPDARTHGLLDTLGEAGINAVIPGSMRGAAPSAKGADAESDFSHALYCAFLTQMMALNMADRRNLEECHFVDARAMRHASNASIY